MLLQEKKIYLGMKNCLKHLTTSFQHPSILNIKKQDFLHSEKKLLQQKLEKIIAGLNITKSCQTGQIKFRYRQKFQSQTF